MRSDRTCGTCAHFSAIAKECRAKSPLGTIAMGPNGAPVPVGFFPMTKADNWCGEWRAEQINLQGVN